jgi:hypothetical protein
VHGAAALGARERRDRRGERVRRTGRVAIEVDPERLRRRRLRALRGGDAVDLAERPEVIAPISPSGLSLQAVFERPPPASSVTTRILPSAVTSAWCEVWMLLGSFGSAFCLFGMIASVLAPPSSARRTSTTNVELIAATYIVLPSREKWTSCGRHNPDALDSSGLRTTTHASVAPAGHRVAFTRDSSMNRHRCTGSVPVVAPRKSTTSTAQSDDGFEIASQSPPG